MNQASSCPEERLPVDERHEIAVNAFRPASGNHLFNEPEFFRLHSTSSSDLYLQLVRRADLSVCATVGFHDLGHGAFASLKRGTFGGVSLNQATDPSLLDRFVKIAFNRALTAGANVIDIRVAPFSHDLALASVMSNILMRNGAGVAAHDLSYDMVVDERPFQARVEYGNAKRIRKCAREGFVGCELDPTEYSAAYALIRDNRLRRGYPISMTAPQIGVMSDLFPGRVRYFGVYSDANRRELVASAICMALTPRILYVFYWADAADMGSFSPIAFLADFIYGIARAEAYTRLDVGTATVGGEPNLGLQSFKRNLGFTESLKLTFRRVDDDARSA